MLFVLCFMLYNMDNDLKKLLEENLQLNKENYAMLKSMKRYFVWQRIVSVIYFILIVGPIILGVVYLPSLLKPILGEYQDLLGASG
jgi:hypothetical protein